MLNESIIPYLTTYIIIMYDTFLQLFKKNVVFTLYVFVPYLLNAEMQN